eukprot:SAG31_NODE_1129_length_9755_cov_2.095070_5_plen_143_part_00
MGPASESSQSAQQLVSAGIIANSYWVDVELELANQGLRERLRFQEERRQLADQRLAQEVNAVEKIAAQVAGLKRQLKQRKVIAAASADEASETTPLTTSRPCVVCKRWLRTGPEWESHSLGCLDEVVKYAIKNARAAEKRST